MKNARTFILSLNANLNLGNMAVYISRGVNKQKMLDSDEQDIVSDMVIAAVAKKEAEKMGGNDETLLAMQVMTFINTL